MLLRALLIIASGLGLAGGGVFTALQLGQSEAPVVAAEIQTTPVIVADGAIDFAAPITGGVVRVQDWPTQLVPQGAFTSLDQVVGDDERGFRRAKRPFVEGEPIIAGKLAGFGEKVTIAQVIDPGKRALSIRVDDVSGVGGFVTPGDRVDIVLTRSRDDDQTATTILQDVLVRGVDQIADQDRDQPVVVRTVTVEVRPDEAQKLVLAQQAGRLSLTLRPVGMRDATVTSTITTNSLTSNAFGSQGEGGADLSVTIRRGAEQEVVTVVR